MSAGTRWLLVGALWAGCTAGGIWSVARSPSWVAWALGLGAVAALLLSALARGGHQRVLVVGVAIAAAGVGLAGGRAALLDIGPLARLAADGGEAEVTAVAVAEARASPTGAWTVLRVERLDGHRVRARAFVRLRDVETAPAPGERVAFSTTARPLEREGFDAHLRRLHAGVALTPTEPLRPVGEAGLLLRGTTRVRERVRQAAGRHLGEDDAALLSGLVTGDTGGQSEAREDAFAAAGLTHLVAVSGSNVALILAGAMAAAAAVGVGARGRRVVGAFAVCWFAVLVRWEPSVLRASVMALLVLLAGLRGRGTDAGSVLAAAVLLLLLVDPALAGQLGFALSVGATAGVLLLAPAVAARLPGPRQVRLLIGASVGAQVGVAPVLLALPDGVPLASLPANLVAVPAAAVASAVGVAAALVAQVSVPAGGALAVMAAPALWVIVWAAETFAEGPTLEVADLLTPAAALLAVAVLSRRRRPRLAVGAVLLAVVFGTLPLLRTAPTVEVLTVTALDVGQGDALLVEAPPAPGVAGGRMLVDGGPDADAALDGLRALGVRTLDAVALSHPHADHAEGLPAVLAAVPVGALVVGPTPLDPETGLSGAEVIQAAATRSVPVVQAAAGHRFALGAATVEVLSPPADGRLGDDANENSLVLRVEAGGAVALLTGDAEVDAQTLLLRGDPGRLQADLIKVPHHGGATNTPGFLDAVGAGTAVVTVGEGNDYGHPHPEVLADLRGAEVWRTDLHGAVRVALGPDGAEVAAGQGAAVGDVERALGTSLAVVHVRPAGRRPFAVGKGKWVVPAPTILCQRRRADPATPPDRPPPSHGTLAASPRSSSSPGRSADCTRPSCWAPPPATPAGRSTAGTTPTSRRRTGTTRPAAMSTAREGALPRHPRRRHRWDAAYRRAQDTEERTTHRGAAQRPTGPRAVQASAHRRAQCGS